MFIIRVKYRSGRSDTGECATEEEARAAVSAAYARMLAAQEGITDVTCWQNF